MLAEFARGGVNILLTENNSSVKVARLDSLGGIPPKFEH